MDATISLQASGRRNSWFSRRLPTLSIGSFKLIVLALALVVLCAFAFVTLSYRQSLQSAAESLEQFRNLNTLVQQTRSANMQVEQFLASGDAAAYAATELALTGTVDSIEQALITAHTADYFTLSRLETVSVDYLNLVRSLNSLILNNAAADTQQVIRQRISSTGLVLEQQMSLTLQTGITAADELLHAQSTALTIMGIVVLLVLIVLFTISFGIVRVITRKTTDALLQIGQAAQSLALGHYDTRIDPINERNPEVARLISAFNRMVENLKAALQAESDANQQNGLQLLKLARQERITAVLEERQRIARELHDSVKQQLFSITLSAGAVLNLSDQAPELVRRHLEHIRNTGHSAQAEMTALLQELIPFSLQERRLEDALLSYLEPLCKTHGLKLVWRVNGTNTLTIAQEHALLRAVQEAISNVIRHSGATQLRVSFNFNLVTHVIVEDNGSGFVLEAVSPSSTGLSLMKTRLKHVGGRCEVESAEGTGTRLTILLDARRAAGV